MVRTIDHTFSLDHTANAYPVLCSIEWVSVFLPSLDKTLIHRKLTLPLPLPLFPSILSDFRQQFVSIHSYSRALQHKGPARVRPWTSRSCIHANHNNIDSVLSKPWKRSPIYKPRQKFETQLALSDLFEPFFDAIFDAEPNLECGICCETLMKTLQHIPTPLCQPFPGPTRRR